MPRVCVQGASIYCVYRGTSTLYVDRGHKTDAPGEGEDTRFVRGGMDEGFIADLAAYVGSGMGAVIMTNGLGGEDLCPEIRRSIAHVYDWPDYAQETRTVVEIDPITHNAYVGEYQRPADPSRSMRVSQTDDRLFVEITNLGTFELHAEAETQFFIAEYGATVQFLPHEDERVDELERWGGPFGRDRWRRVA